MENEFGLGYIRLQREERARVRAEKISNIWKYAKIPVAIALLGIGAYQTHKPRDFEGIVDSVANSDRFGTPATLSVKVKENPSEFITIDIDEQDISTYRGQSGRRIEGQYNRPIWNLFQRQLGYGHVIDRQ